MHGVFHEIEVGIRRESTVSVQPSGLMWPGVWREPPAQQQLSQVFLFCLQTRSWVAPRPMEFSSILASITLRQQQPFPHPPIYDNQKCVTRLTKCPLGRGAKLSPFRISALTLVSAHCPPGRGISHQPAYLLSPSSADPWANICVSLPNHPIFIFPSFPSPPRVFNCLIASVTSVLI